MASVFNFRRLSNLYSASDVVMESSATTTSDGFLKLRVGAGFGIHGKVIRHKSIKLSAIDLLGVTKELKKHEESILELVDLLEQVNDWVLHRYTAYNRTNGTDCKAYKTLVLFQESPVMFHCTQDGRRVEVKIFGEGLYDLELNMDCKSESKRSMFVQRMNELLAVFRNHLFDIEQANFKAVMEGVSA